MQACRRDRSLVEAGSKEHINLLPSKDRKQNIEVEKIHSHAENCTVVQSLHEDGFEFHQPSWSLTGSLWIANSSTPFEA